MNFTTSQLEAINHVDGNCCVLASAGSGKTTVLVERIKNLVRNCVAPENILAITFSRKAASNMRDKLGDLYSGVSIDTFHALGYKILRESKTIPHGVEIIKEWERKKIIAEICVKEMFLYKNEDDVDSNMFLNYISYQKNNLNENDEYPVKLKFSEDTMQKVYSKYEKVKNIKNIDFDDMILKTYILLSENDDIRRYYQSKFKYILVDEMQDTNKGQYEILKLLGSTNNNMFVVGDPLQCIYEWRLAHNDYLINFNKDWIDTKVINLNINFRSTSNIVNASNTLVKNMKETTHEFYVESVANSGEFKDPQIMSSWNEREEADDIARSIKENMDYDFSDIAVLTRTNFQTQALEVAFYNNQIPYDVVDGMTFYKLREIQDMLAYLRLAYNLDDNESFLRVYNTPNRYLGKVFLEEVRTFATKRKLSLYVSMQSFPRAYEWRYRRGIESVTDVIQRIKRRKKYNVGELITIIRKMTQYDDYISKENTENNDECEKIENLDALVDMGKQYKSIQLFLEDVDKILNVKQTQTGVKLMTIHRSKGLEFPVVFVAGVSKGILPHNKNSNVDEEKRLFYVAMTRAMKELYISYSEMYGKNEAGESEFIKLII